MCIGSTPEMASIARRHGFAVVKESFDARGVARALRALSAQDVDALKR